MCGIVGVLAAPGQRADRAVLERMTASLRHRGPDSVGYHVDGPVGLGVARLRVIDVAGGDQPIANEEGTVWVALNGEIYNYVELRAALLGRGHRFRTGSDTEVIAHAWEDEGDGCLDALNGMFGMALWDARRRQLLLARDRMGEKPLYYAATTDGIVFASELRALLVHPGVSRRLDPRGVARYLAYDFVPDPHALIDGVHKLPPGHTLTVVDGKTTLRRYWDLPFTPRATLPEASWPEAIAARFDEAVRLRLRSDVPLGCFLSGGVDSTAVAATAVRQVPRLRTFSVGYAAGRHDERAFARDVAERLGTQHEELVVDAAAAGAVLRDLGVLLDEPIADMSFVPLHLLARSARAHVTVALTGDGGDEVFGGYPSMAAAWWHARFAALPAPVRRALVAGAERGALLPGPLREFLRVLDYGPEARNQALLGGLTPDRLRPLLSAPTRDALGTFDPYADLLDVQASCESADAADRLLYRYCKLYLAGQNLQNTDRASMAVGLELRAPFLDHTLVELLGGIPTRAKVAGLRKWKALAKRAFADRLPPPTMRRRKQGFGAPFAEWFRGPLAPVLADGLHADRMRAAGVFDPAAVQALVTAHTAGAADHARTLWALFAFEAWRAHTFRAP